MTDSERIAAVLRHYKLSKNAFGLSLGDKNGMRLQHVESNRNSISSKLASDICKVYPELNYDWLLNGRGEMFASVETNTLPKVSISAGVPYYDVDFIGGFDVVDSDSTTNPTFYINFAPFNDADYWVNVTGKSMSPFISHGDLIAIKRLHNWKEFMLFGEIYAIVTDDFRTIKIVTKGSKEGYLKLIPYSDDPVFVEQEIPIHLIKQVFAVKGSIKKFF